MCLIVFAHHAHPKYSFILLANRDEHHERPAQQMDFWEEELDLIGGRDLRARGTWLAMNKSGSFAAVTNVRASAIQLNTKSKGHLPVDFLKSPQTNQAFMRGLQAQEINYNRFNFLTRKGNAFLHFNNQLGIINQVPAGMHGLCNASLNTSWTKLDKLNSRFKASIDKNIDNVTLLHLMMNKQMAEDKFLSETGITQEMERASSSIFINLPTYGTRSTTLITIDNEGVVELTEIIHHLKQNGNQKHVNFKII